MSKKIILFLSIFSPLILGGYVFASTILNSQTDISGGWNSIYLSTKSQAFSASTHYTATRLEAHVYTEGSLHLYLTDNLDNILADCTSSAGGTDWKGCNISVEVQNGSTYKIKANGGDLPDAVWKQGASGVQTYKIYGDEIVPTNVFTFISLPATALADISKFIPTAFAGLWIIIAMVIGLPIAFWVIKKITKLIHF